MNDFRQLALAGVVVVGTAAACAGGTETDNPGKNYPFLGFEASACKKEEAEAVAGAGASGRTQGALASASDYDGLRCVAWQKVSDEIRIVRLLNVNAGCSVDWRGDSRVREDGSLELTLENSKCAVALCGWCLYDFAFTMRDVPAPAGLRLEVGQIACAGEEPTWDPTVVLPADAGDSGIVCRYANQFAYDQQLLEQDRCGSKFGTCGDGGGFCAASGGAIACRDNLVCTPADDASRCLEPCTTDADCSPRAVSACVDGVCRLSATY